MGYSSFFYKEINYTNRGKRVARKTWNGYNQMIISLKHSLRLEKSSGIHIIKEKTKENIYVSDFDISSHEKLLEKIENDILEKIKKFENIDIEDKERKKIFKDFQNVKKAVSKKMPLDLLDLELQDTSDPNSILKNIVYKHKIKGIKAKDKRTLKTIENYINISQLYAQQKTKTRKYNNQTLLKEIIFKVPESQKLDIQKDEWEVIIKNFKNEYFEKYDLYLYAIHADEGNENKSHVHLFLSSFNKEKNDFDIQKHIFDYINTKYNLELDFTKNADHKQLMKQFQEDFYTFLNQQLSLLKKQDRVMLKHYLTQEDIEKRLKIHSEDTLTIDQKHTKLINEKIQEKLEALKQPAPKIIEHKYRENTSFFSKEKTHTLEITTPTKEDLKRITDAIKHYSNVSKFVQDLQQEKQNANNRFYILKQKLEEDKRYFQQKENELLENINTLKNQHQSIENQLLKDTKNIKEMNGILKNIIKKTTNIDIQTSDIDENLIIELIKKNEKAKQVEKEKLEAERSKNKKTSDKEVIDLTIK